MSGKKKRFFASHAKSTAALISLGVHGVLVVLALTFVAVTVIKKDDQQFKAKEVSRPKMNLRKLQVPVKIKKKSTPKPKLRKRIVVKTQKRTIPDIKMPEISGVKGGIGSMGGGGGVQSLGFSMPELNLFGVKSKGEKVFFVLDSMPPMMSDEIGGLTAYNLIKQEIYTMLDRLSPTVLFNIAIYDWSKGGMLFPQMVPATPDNVAKVRAWLDPVNVDTGSGGQSAKIGYTTAGPGGLEYNKEGLADEVVSDIRLWLVPVMRAMEQQADSVYLLTSGWGGLNKTVSEGTGKAWPEEKRKKWLDLYEQAKQKLKEENEKRRAKGQPPVVTAEGIWALNKRYFPNAETPPASNKVKYYFTPDDIAGAMERAFGKSSSLNSTALRSGLSKKKKKKNGFSLNVIHFVPEDAEKKENPFNKLTAICDGKYRQLKGLSAIDASAYK